MKVSPSQKPSKKRRLTRWLLGFLSLIVLFIAGCLAYGCTVSRSIDREIANTPRNSKTGVVRGAEAVTLEPQDTKREDKATTACLLVHGFIGSRQDFNKLGSRLTDAGFHVRMMRLPGHGTTPRDWSRQTPEIMIGAVRDEYDRLAQQYEAVHVVGFSMGGTLATLLAAEAPVDRLVLAAPYYGVSYQWYYVLPVETWTRLIHPLVPYVKKSDNFIKVNRSEAKGKFYSYQAVSTEGSLVLYELGRRARQPEVLAAIDCPVLLVMSENDTAASPSRARQAFARIDSSEKEAAWFTGSDHHLFWDYDRHEVVRAITSFLGKNGEAEDVSAEE